MPRGPEPKPPTVTVVMASYNCGPYIGDAIATALAQRGVEVDVIVSDDRSSDDTVAIVRALMENEPRIRLIEAPENGGPGRARNRALEVARGDWIAVLDSDDLIHPGRLGRLIAAADTEGADIVADDLLIFEDGFTGPARTLLTGRWAEAPFVVDAELWVRANGLYESGYPVLGYLKPVFRASLFWDSRRRYNETMRIAEDYDLVLRLLADGAKFVVHPDLGYYYRKRATSISFRMPDSTVEAMRTGNASFLTDYPKLPAPVIEALGRRMKSLDRALAFGSLVEALKARSLAGALRAVRTVPSSLLLLRLPILARLKRLKPRFRRPAEATGGNNLAIVSRQRVVGPTNGSSIYLLSIAETLKSAGHRLHFVSPSPVVFGSWPLLKLQPELSVFDSISIRGGLRFGRYVIATDPRIALRAVARVVETLAMRLKLLKAPLLGPAPYAIAQPLTRADEVYLASELPRRADAILFDYCFLTETRPLALRPGAPALVLMHDLFSSRAEQFRRINERDSVASLTFEDEMARLAGADAVIAIQSQEGAVVAGALGGSHVLVAPMAVKAVEAISPGEDDRLLFVGSKTAPNIDGIRWFLDEVWPKLRDLRPHVALDIVGSVGATVGAVPDGVAVHGQVGDLAPYYARAGVVISPLRAGSGLKVKIVEALSYAKASVVTTTTSQGIETLVADAVRIEDEAAGQARVIAELAGSAPRRQQLCQRALDVARSAFSPEACYSPIVDFYRSGRA